MTQPAKQPMSGLRSIKRDFSSSKLPSASQDSCISDSDATTIPWMPSAPQKQLSGLEKRLKDIQDALNGNIDSSEKVLTSSQNLRGNPLQKRSSSSQDPPAKRRQPPPSWDQLDHGSRKAQFVGRVADMSRSPQAVQALVVPASSSSTNAASDSAAIFLSPEQIHILQLVKSGESLFYTGSAGTGKSVLLREIIKALRQKHIRSPDAVAVTASTGIAACNIGGVTVHSFAGIGLGRESAEHLTNKIKRNKKAMSRWLRTQVLIIDEVSMVEGELFDKLAQIGSNLRGKAQQPFGGIQVIVTGDFFQLPPVAKNAKVKFAFEAEMWGETVKNTFNLTKVFRQRDQEFVDMLNEMRFGRLSTKSIQKFKRLERDIVYEDGLGATELFPRREDVERSNQTRMAGIQGTIQRFVAYDGGSITDENQREKMLGNFMAPQHLELKVGAQVMLIKNLDETLVNGSMGKVVSFVDPSDMNALLDVDQNPGDRAAASSKPASKAGKETKRPASNGKLMPVVDFLQPGGRRRRVLIQPEVFKVELPNGEVQVSRTQLPLILAWAMSIHKSQGQTLERVKVDLRRIFEKGQAYVALSRATSLDGLQVLGFDPAKVKAHPTVVEWTRTLQTVPDQ